MEKGSEYMSHSTIYRICLLVVVILTIIGGIFYYVNYMESQVKVTEGTLVMEDGAGNMEEMIRAAEGKMPQENLTAGESEA